jgi:hypothetical protein
MGAAKTWAGQAVFGKVRSGGEPTIEHSGAHDGDAVRATWRPAHPLPLGHPRVGDLVHATLGA